MILEVDLHNITSTKFASSDLFEMSKEQQLSYNSQNK